MKKIKLILLIFSVLIFIGNSYPQYKTPYGNPLNENTNYILGFINPKNFSMKHSFGVSILSSRYGTISLTSYINTLSYKISDKLFMSADVELSYSPYVSSAFGKSYSKLLQDEFTGIRLSRLNLDYKISDNSYIKFEFRNLKNYYFDPYYYNNYGIYDNRFYDTQP
ncbi:MAG: hypothetical protein N2490_08965 [Ignavibacteria bacterium]|nr:hypothetical protein [Ignavibacteria bacterium]